MVRHSIIAGITALYAFSSAAYADTFDASHMVTEAILASTVVHSSVNFDQIQMISMGGNTITEGSFGDMFGVVGIVQNTGVNSNIQQAISVGIGGFSIEFH